MAYFDTKGLFGTTPEEMQREIFEKSQARRQKEMEFLASGTLTPGSTYLGLKTLEPLRTAFDRTGEDPRVTALRGQEAAAREVFSKFPEVKDANTMRQLGGELMRIGMPEQAGKAFAAAARMEQGRSTQENEILFWEKRLKCGQYPEGSEEKKKCQLQAEEKYITAKRSSPFEKGQAAGEIEFNKAKAQSMNAAPELLLANEQLNTAFDALRSMNLKGGIPERLKTSVQQAFGKVPKDKAEFMLLTGELMYQRLKPLFGGVISEGEREAIEKIYPGIDKGAQANEAILAQLKRYYDMALRRTSLYNKSTSFDDYNRQIGEMLMNPSNFPAPALTIPPPPPAATTETTTAPVTAPTSTPTNDFKILSVK